MSQKRTNYSELPNLLANPERGHDNLKFEKRVFLSSSISPVLYAPSAFSLPRLLVTLVPTQERVSGTLLSCVQKTQVYIGRLLVSLMEHSVWGRAAGGVS